MWFGSGRVLRVTATSRGAAVTLGLPAGGRIALELDVPPETTGGPVPVLPEGRPLAVQIRRVGSEYRCSVLATGPAGPYRVQVGLRAALSACQAGVHGVITQDRASAAPAISQDRVASSSTRT